MRGLAIALVALLVVGAVSVGAYNVFTGANNKPMPLYDVIKEFSKIKLDSSATLDTWERFITHFEKLNGYIDDDIEWKEMDENQFSLWEKIESFLEENTFILSLTYRITLSAFYIAQLLLSVILDVLRIAFALVSFAYKLLQGVPST